MLTLFSPDFEVISKKKKKKKKVKVFTVQQADFTRKWLIAVFALIQISLIIYQSWSLGQNIRDRDETLTLQDRDFEQKLETRPRLERSETRPRLERSETETRHETFETKRLKYFANIFDTKF